ncbi:MAG: RhuM family protein [Leucobacter sp.]
MDETRSTDGRGVSADSTGEVILYRAADGAPAIEVRLEHDSVWLSQQQIADLFGTTRENITMHLRGVYREGELAESATCKESLQVRIEGNRQVRRKTLTYNLDAIISVGYRVKSKVATQFRIWATARLRDYLVRGYALNEQRLEQLGAVVKVLSRSDDELVAGVADLLAEYLPGLTLLRDYDEGAVETQPKAVPGWTLTPDEARAVIRQVAAEFPADTLLGRERGDALEATVATIYQGFAGHELYPTVEEKAANLLYLVVKDHPLADGNNALAAATLMIAMSDPGEKDLMIALLVRMLAD